MFLFFFIKIISEDSHLDTGKTTFILFTCKGIFESSVSKDSHFSNYISYTEKLNFSNNFTKIIYKKHYT